MSFAADFGKWAKHVNLSMDRATKAVALDVANKIGQRSPVRDGLYLANHRVNIGSVDSSITTAMTGNRNTVSQKVAGLGINAGDDIYISNSLPYARRLEYDAWSAQATAGIYRISAMDTKRSISRIVKSAGL